MFEEAILAVCSFDVRSVDIFLVERPVATPPEHRFDSD
jgi:hypothetical protein